MVSRSKRRREAIARAKAAKGATRRPQPQRSRSTMNSTSIIQTGIDVIGISVVSESSPIGTGMLRFVINPRALTGTRLGDYAQLWARWRPLRLQLEVCTAAGMMVPGGYLAAWSAQPNEQIPAGESAILHLAALVTQVQKPIGMNTKLNIPCSSTARWYVFEGEAVDTSHGVILAVVSGMIGVKGGVGVTFKLHWTIEFNGPDIPRPLEEYFIEPESDYAGIFTDSVSDWADGKKLTFKHAEGGSVVPWPGVRSQMVYTPTAGVKIYYVSGGKAVEAKWFSRIIDSDIYSSALAVHASQADAEAYQRSGDLTKVVNYEAASGWATPTLPRLKGEAVSVKFGVDRQLASTSREVVEPAQPAIDYDLLAAKLAPLVLSGIRPDRPPEKEVREPEPPKVVQEPEKSSTDQAPSDFEVLGE